MMHIYCTARATGKDWAIRVFFLPDGQRYPRPFRGHDKLPLLVLGRAARMRALRSSGETRHARQDRRPVAREMPATEITAAARFRSRMADGAQ